MKIEFVKGDATQPQGKGRKIIVHICNDIGAWGAGFVLALSRRWTGPEEEYRRSPDVYSELGNVMYVHVEDDIIVANMIAQHGIGKDHQGNPPVRYDAIKSCLQKVDSYATKINATVHMPRIGCGLAGGDWKMVEQIIRETLSVDVVVYDF